MKFSYMLFISGPDCGVVTEALTFENNGAIYRKEKKNISRTFTKQEVHISMLSVEELLTCSEAISGIDIAVSKNHTLLIF